MAILVEQLTVWDIGFRWAGYDPRRFYLRIPLEVENNFRTLMDAILSGEIACDSISLEKRDYAKDEIKESIYYWIDEIYACIWGKRINRELMRWARIGRMDFKLWCERMNINPLPEFWFPKGWNLHYELPEDTLSPGRRYLVDRMSPEDREQYLLAEPGESAPQPEDNQKLRPNQEIRLACQQIATAIWAKETDRTIASVVKDPLVQEYGGARHYNDETVREWVKAVAPDGVKNRRGRPKNKD